MAEIEPFFRPSEKKCQANFEKIPKNYKGEMPAFFLQQNKINGNEKHKIVIRQKKE